jgi:hypothetical protein
LSSCAFQLKVTEKVVHCSERFQEVSSHTTGVLVWCVGVVCWCGVDMWTRPGVTWCGVGPNLVCEWWGLGVYSSPLGGWEVGAWVAQAGLLLGPARNSFPRGVEKVDLKSLFWPPHLFWSHLGLSGALSKDALKSLLSPFLSSLLSF